MYVLEVIQSCNVQVVMGLFSVMEMREIAQSFEDGGMPGTIGTYM